MVNARTVGPAGTPHCAPASQRCYGLQNITVSRPRPHSTSFPHEEATVDHEARSRRLNAALWGDPCEMVCARAHRLRLWPIVWLLDMWFRARWGEAPSHCKRIRDRERLRRADALDDRARLSGL
jgi:hypothetical protein